MNPPEPASPPRPRVRGGSALDARLCLIALLAAIFFSLMAISVRAAASYVELLPNWSQGQTLHYQVTQTRRTAAGDETPLEQTAQGDVRIDVLEVGANGYLVAWTAGELKREGADANRETVASAGGWKAMRLLLRIGLRGTFEGVENWKEVQADSRRRLDRDAEVWKNGGQSDATVQKMREASLRLIATRQRIEDTYASAARIFFMALGRRYPLGRSLSFAGKLPDPIGGNQALPCHGRWLLKGVGRDGVAMLDWTESVSAEAMRESIELSAKMLAARFGRSTPSFRVRNLTIDEQARFNVHARSGWPQSLSYKQTVQSTTSSREEKREAILQFTQLAD